MPFWRLFHFGGEAMSAESFKCKLTAILSADIKGYSRLMGEDEAETVKAFASSRSHSIGQDASMPALSVF
jgi:class 3 adenylate cyclase